MAKLRIPVGVAVALRGLAVGLQAVARIVEQFGDQGAAHLVALRLQRLRQSAHALAGPPQRRFRVAACRWFDQGFEILEQCRVLRYRRPASGPRPPNPRRRAGPREGGGLVRGQFLQAPPDRARCNPGRHRDRRNPAVTRGERLRCRDQTTTPFVEERRHRRKPLSDGFDIDHHTIYGMPSQL